MIEQVMILELINMNILGNEIWRYLLFVLIMLSNYPLSKVIVHVLDNFLIMWAKKANFKFIDILLSSLNPPVSMFIIAATFYIGKSFLYLGILEELFHSIFTFLIVIPFVYFLIKFSTETLAHYLKNHKKKGGSVNEAAIDLLTKMIKYGLVIIGILIILSNLGYNITAILTGVGIGGLAFALAAQDILKNFFAGIALVFDKTFNKGERIVFQGNSGRIEELNLRSTKVRTYDGTLLTIPNAKLADNIVENVTKVPNIKVSLTVGLTYDTPAKKIEKAKQILEKIIKEHPKTIADRVWIWFDNFNAYSLDIQVVFFSTYTMADWPERVYYKDEIFLEIKKQFDKEKLSFAFPTQTLDLDFREDQLQQLGSKKTKK